MTNPLHDLAGVEEIVISFVRPDGTTGSTPIWDVEVGDEIYVRSAGGPSGGWYRRLRANPDGEVRHGRTTYPVRAEPVDDADLLTKITEAYRHKYRSSPSLRPFATPEAVSATFRLRVR
jgi:hypothetical protein